MQLAVLNILGIMPPPPKKKTTTTTTTTVTKGNFCQHVADVLAVFQKFGGQLFCRTSQVLSPNFASNIRRIKVN